ncbi:MAG: flagellar hook assembly protein FlgD [Desulfuromonadaceae bacterium]|nr:flagellar hook assembly protein FlgD [Desulfuromonas sp.]MDY0184994.1 flagellar hook assembly protein FlgD [Desulfuromonadaceae bacterium]
MADISGVTSGNLKSSSIAPKHNELGKDDFLALMVAQLKNQDPMAPVDSTEFTAQLAQFSSLEQLLNINANLGKMGDTSVEVQRLSALSMIGTEVVTKGSKFTYNGEPVKLGYNMSEAAEYGVLYIRNEAGDTVSTKPLLGMHAGQHMVEWDGTGDSGNVLPQGKYSVAISAFNGENPVAAHPLVRSLVIGVDLIDGKDVLVTESGEYKLAEIESVRSS